MKVNVNKNFTPDQEVIRATDKKQILKSDLQIEELNKIENRNFSIKNLLDSLFKDLISNQKSKDMVLKILNDENILQNIKDTALDLKSILNNFKNSKLLSKSTISLKKLLLDINELDAKSLQKQIKKSGVFLEARLADSSSKPKEVILDDVKATLLLLKQELSQSKNLVVKDTLLKIDKVLTNINYYQLVSFSMGANILYLPLLWGELDEGQINIKKLRQKRYFCEINLKLKNIGKIDLLVMLFDDISINLSIFVQSDKFLKKIRENLQLLKQGISSVGLIPSNIYLYDFSRDKKIKKDIRDYALNQSKGVGISLHV